MADVLSPVHVRSVATAVPPHRLPQSELAEFARRFFGGHPQLDKLLQSFSNAGIDERQLARPVSWYEEQHSFAEKNEVYREVALSLSERAGRAAIEQAEIAPGDVGAIVFVSSTGIATPSLDSPLAQALGLSPQVMRVPLWGLGCAGGGAGLARASALCAAIGKPVLLVCAEICTVTFVQDDHRKSNVIATALFGDGAAAAIVAPGDGKGPRVLGGHSHLIPESEWVMGWDLRATGLAVRFSPEIPKITYRAAPLVLQEVTERFELSEPPQQLVLHPGGPKVIDAYETALSLPAGSLAPEREILRRHGNMSGPTVLFVLNEVLASPPEPGTHALVLGLGPGFCAEGALLQF